MSSCTWTPCFDSSLVLAGKLLLLLVGVYVYLFMVRVFDFFLMGSSCWQQLNALKYLLTLILIVFSGGLFYSFEHPIFIYRDNDQLSGIYNSTMDE